jgi:hypothetical protein
MILNLLLASISLANLYTIVAGAVEVDIPAEDDFAWTIDTRDEEANFMANFTVTNHGLYDITDLDIRAKVFTEKGNLLIDYRYQNLLIPSGKTNRFNIYATLPFHNIDPEEWRHLLVNDSVFYLDVDISANYLWGLGRFVVDEVLAYPWEAPINQIEIGRDESITEIITLVTEENPSTGEVAEKILDEWSSNPILARFYWGDAYIRLEFWPQGDNISQVNLIYSLDLFKGKRTVIFQIEFLIKKEADTYEIEFEDFSFKYG